ncbi:MAG: hypothetical protein HRU38_20565, partial [Saccharospirillaceae bacterium]|nr:hypothetical protein [Pseudomonadales bacterium]NRB81027.1 hypothetical protein [Saccharospirillaceae bacterium]
MRLSRLVLSLHIVSMTVLAQAAPKQSFINKSDVLFTQPMWQELDVINNDYGKYDEYQTSTTMWGFLPPTFPDFNAQTNYDENMLNYENGISNHDLAGIDWVSRIEWDVIWQGMISLYPDTYQQAMAIDINGDPIEIGWFPGHYFFSSHEPLFQDYIKWQISDVAFYGDVSNEQTVDAILFDSQQSTPAHYAYGGDFSAACMQNFQTWLKQTFTAIELDSLGISDVDQFNYREFLITEGYNKQNYEQAAQVIPNDIPLSNQFRLFLQQFNNQYLQDLVEYTDQLAQQKGYTFKPGVGHIAVGTSSPLLDPYFKGVRFAPTDAFDFYVQEFNHQADATEVSSDVMVLYKIAENLDKPLALTAQPAPDWYFMVSNPQATDLVKTWIAQAYANGAVFMAPEHMWAYDENNTGTQAYYDPQPGDYDYYYRFIAQHPQLFDDYYTASNVVLVHANKSSQITDYAQLDVFAAASGLMKNNIPYKLVVAGDDNWPKYLTDKQQSDLLDKAKVIVTTGFNNIELDANQKNKLDSYQNKIVQWPNLDGINELLEKELSVNKDNIALFAREKQGINNTASTAKIVHLVNRNFNQQTLSTDIQENITLTIHNR